MKTNQIPKYMWRNRYSLMALVLLGGIIFWFSLNIIWLGDDFNYKYWCEETDRYFDPINCPRIESVGDIFDSLYNHFFFTNGRSLAHFFVYLFCGISGQFWFAIFNALAYICLVLLILKLSGNRLSNLKATVSCIFMVILFLSTIMGPSCQIGYIWMACIILCFIWIFLNPPHYSPWLVLPLFIFGLLAGNAHEAYNIGIGGALIIYFLHHRGRIGNVRLILSISFGLGLLLICLSPAAHQRAIHANKSLFEFLRIFALSSWAMLSLVTVCLYRKYVGKQSFRSMFGRNRFYWCVLFLSLLFNIAIGIENNRQLFGVYLMSIILLLRILPGRSFNTPFTVVFSILTLAFLAINYKEVKVQDKTLKEIEEQYDRSESGQVFVDIPNFEIFASWHRERNEIVLEHYFLDSNTLKKRPPMKIYPKYFEGKIHDRLDNGYVITDDGKTIIMIQSKTDPQPFTVPRSLFGRIPVTAHSVDFGDPCVEGDHWRMVREGTGGRIIAKGLPRIGD